MQLKIQKINYEIIKKSENFFGDFFCENLKKEKSGTYEESLVARYLIEKENKNIGKIFSSISHKKNLVFVGINNSKIGVDIEILKIRDKNFLENFREKEYKFLGEKNWENFYILWTAKESIIKFENLKLDDMQKIILENIEKIDENISGINFQKKLIFMFENKKILVYSGIKKDLFYSVCL